MTELKQQLIDRIKTTGPISVADYMGECLLHPEHGYYSTRDPFGEEGDFTTAPEISQMFGELLGLCLAQSWLEQGRPEMFILAELGPGRGTLMSDVLRATQGVEGFHAAARITLIEASAALQQVQRQTLAGHDVAWVKTVDQLPDGPLFLLANEFFDALPIRQYVRSENGWRERCVGIEGDELAFGLSDEAEVPALTHRRNDCKEGDLVEVCAPAAAIAGEIGRRIAEFGGAAVIVDYGDWRSLGDTLQAMRGHAYDHPLANPGAADLTAHVDFEALAVAAVTHTPVSKIVPQGELLGRLGIAQRAEALAQGLSGEALETHTSAFQRLTDPTQMGTLFKAIAFYPNGHTPPPGFSP